MLQANDNGLGDRYVTRRWGVMTPGGSPPQGLGAAFVPWDWGVMTPAGAPPAGLGDVNFDDVLASMPLWSGSPVQKAVAQSGLDLTFRNVAAPAPAADGFMDWLRTNQTFVLVVGGSLLGLALLKR